MNKVGVKMDSNELRHLLVELLKTDISNNTLGETLRALLPITYDSFPPTHCKCCDYYDDYNYGYQND
jgi:hypothetical protein